MPLVRDTVAIPVARGINVNTPARLVDAQELLEARNARFTAPVGARKRRGHTGQKIRGAKPIPAGVTEPSFTKSDFSAPFYAGNRNIDSNWILGYGYTPNQEEELTPSTPLQTSPHPAALAFGAATRDSETLTWDGHRLLSRTGDGFAELNAVMPALRSEPLAKANIAQTKPDVADNGTIRVAVWITNGRAYYSVVASALGTLISGPTPLYPEDVVAVRAVPIGGWVHLFISSAGTESLEVCSIHSSTPTAYSSRTLGECNGYFDVFKVAGDMLGNPEDFIAVAQSRTASVQVRFLATDGSIVTSLNWTANTGAATDIASVAICVSSASVNLVWRTAAQVQVRAFSITGVPQGSVVTLGSVTSATRSVAVAAKWLRGVGALLNVYWDDQTDHSVLNMARLIVNASTIVYTAQAHHLLIGSQGFSVGDRTFIWAARNSTYQSSWILLDETLRPVGRAEYVSANTPTGTDAAYTNFSVNWQGDAPSIHRCVFHCAFSTRVRVPVEPTQAGINPPAVYSEPFIKFARLDFLPRLRAAQAGRTTYFAGAQLWSYDGAELTEAGFLLAPEGVSCQAATVGELTASGNYTYRVDLCYRNAQNEEVRSASFYTNQVVLSEFEQRVTLTIPTVLTRRENAYFLIFRNESAGTVWYLCNSRDPSSPLFLRNDQSVASVTYTDSTVSDTELLSREQHPNQSFDYLDPFAAPASEVIAAGRDRLWLAGGEIPAGQAHPSRLFNPGEAPAFHADLAIQVDRSAEPITAIGFIGEYTVFFRETHNYILDGVGPDNIRQGEWGFPRRSLTDIGAISQESVQALPAGLIFQSPAGFRLFTPGGGIIPIGQPVDSLAQSLNVTAAVIIGKDQEIRFYGWDGTTLVFNYQYGVWSTWDLSAAGAVRDPVTNLAVVATPTGILLHEADGVWNDNGSRYKHRIRFAWLRAGNLLDFQQVRRIGALGEGANHDIHVDVYYNEREFAEETFDWSVPDSGTQNQDTFGSETFGAGNFGDDTAVEGIQFRDSTWAWRRRLYRRKCSVISVAIDDNYTDGEGFTLTALALELARKPGLDRTPWRGGNYTNTGGSGSTETGN